MTELMEYLRLRKVAEDYYQSHPEIAELVFAIGLGAPDKMTPEAVNEASRIIDREGTRRWKQREAVISLSDTRASST